MFWISIALPTRMATDKALFRTDLPHERIRHPVVDGFSEVCLWAEDPFTAAQLVDTIKWSDKINVVVGAEPEIENNVCQSSFLIKDHNWPLNTIQRWTVADATPKEEMSCK